MIINTYLNLHEFVSFHCRKSLQNLADLQIMKYKKINEL